MFPICSNCGCETLRDEVTGNYETNQATHKTPDLCVTALGQQIIRLTSKIELMKTIQESILSGNNTQHYV